jgi:hypothetical protein
MAEGSKKEEENLVANSPAAVPAAAADAISHMCTPKN